MRAVFIGLLGVIVLGCQSPAKPATRSHTVVTKPPFRFVYLNNCCKADEQRRIEAEAESGLSFLKQRLGPHTRPGDFGHVTQSPPSHNHAGHSHSTPRSRDGLIPVKIVDRRGRSHTDIHGIEVVKSQLSKFHLTHELVHWLAGASWPPLDEGLAVLLTEELRGPEDEADCDLRTLVYINLNTLRPLGTARLLKDMTRVDYDASASFVKYLLARFGQEKFFELYNANARNYFGVLGKSEQDLMDDWLETLKKQQRHRCRSREFYRFRARITTGLQGATTPHGTYSKSPEKTE